MKNKKNLWRTHIDGYGYLYVDADDAMEACARVEAFLDKELSKSSDRSSYKITSVDLVAKKNNRI